MRKTLVIWLAFAMVGVAASMARAEEGKGGQAAAFLRNDVGTRAGGMGDAFVAVADDASALHYNPGGLYQVDHLIVGLMYSAMSLDRSHYRASAIYTEEDVASFGVMFTGFGVSDIDGRDPEGEHTSFFDDSEWALTLGAARHVSSFAGVGASFKYFKHSLADNEATAIGFDLGVHARWMLKSETLRKVRLGFAVSNLGSELEWDTESSRKEDVPVTLRGGGSADFALGEVELLLAVDGVQTTDESFAFHAGAEAWVVQELGLRAGLDDDEVTFGASVRYRQFQFDYAYLPDKLEEGATSRLGLQINF